MADKPVFIDTNILFYAYDKDAGEKHAICKELVTECWKSPLLPYISIQVIQEFFVNIYKRTEDFSLSESLSSYYLSWNIVGNDTVLFLESLRFMKRYKLSYWDSAIVAAANRAGVEELWTEDLNSGQEYGEVKAVNPMEENL